MQSIEVRIKRFLTSNGIDLFWTSSAMRHIERALNTNRYFAKGASKFALIAAKKNKGMIKEFSCNVLLYFPDPDEERTALMVYTFDPNRKNAHSVNVHIYS